MDEDADKRVRAKRSNDLDRLSKLPDSLLCRVLLNIPTKDVVKSSVLSKRWRNLWRYVPGLNLAYSDFPEYNACVSFIDRFLGFNSESCLQKFKLKDGSLVQQKYEWKWDEPDATHVTRWINAVLKRRVQHLHALVNTWDVDKDVEVPLTVYTCESLLSLKLCDVLFAKPKAVSLPFVKVIYLDRVRFANDWSFEMLISGCPVLERLTMTRSPHDNIKVLRVCSQSLLRFTHIGQDIDFLEEELVVAIDAPKLENLELFDEGTNNFIVINLGSLVKMDLNIWFNLSSYKSFDPNDLPKRNIIRSFLQGISNVKGMVIYLDTLEVLYNYSRCERLPLLRTLTSLRADFSDYRWELLPVFLESCPNLKSISLGFSRSLGEQPISILPGPHCFLPTLECVKITKPLIDDAAEMELVSYFLENSTVLKKLTLFLNPDRKKEASVILERLLTIPRLSTSCQVVVSDPPSFWGPC